MGNTFKCPVCRRDQCNIANLAMHIIHSHTEVEITNSPVNEWSNELTSEIYKQINDSWAEMAKGKSRLYSDKFLDVPPGEKLITPDVASYLQEWFDK